MKKTITIILEALILGMLFVVFLIFATSRTEVVGIRSFDVLTGSMNPALPVGTILFTKKQNVYKKGEIITFTKGTDNITHRIVSVDNNNGKIFYRTRGDANNVDDNWKIPKNNVTGKVIFGIPFVGRIIMFVRTVPGFILLIGIPALIFAGFEIWNIKKEFEKEIEKKLLRKLNINENL